MTKTELEENRVAIYMENEHAKQAVESNAERLLDAAHMLRESQKPFNSRPYTQLDNKLKAKIDKIVREEFGKQKYEFSAMLSLKGNSDNYANFIDCLDTFLEFPQKQRDWLIWQSEERKYILSPDYYTYLDKKTVIKPESDGESAMLERLTNFVEEYLDIAVNLNRVPRSRALGFISTAIHPLLVVEPDRQGYHFRPDRIKGLVKSSKKR